MGGDWFDELLDTGRHLLDVMPNVFYLAYSWAKEWQPLLASLLIVFAAFIFARASLKGARNRAPATLPAGTNTTDKSGPDLRLAWQSFGGSTPPGHRDFIDNLERLRSLIRSALTSLTLMTEKENPSAHFFCQRIADLQLERFPLPPNATNTTGELYTTLLNQLASLRLILKKEVPTAEISEILVQLNATARTLTTALAPASDTDRPAKSQVR